MRSYHPVHVRPELRLGFANQQGYVRACYSFGHKIQRLYRLRHLIVRHRVSLLGDMQQSLKLFLK